MFRLFRSAPSTTDLLTSELLDQDTFYPRFMQDMKHCKEETIIESPFITSRRFRILRPVFETLLARGVKIMVNTKHPSEHNDNFMKQEAASAIDDLLDIGATVLYTGGHHRKLAILDRSIMYEGSLNILSQGQSCEIMRRIESTLLAQQMVEFTKLDKIINS